MPMLAIVRIREAGGRDFSLWLPLLVIWLVLAPLALIILPFFFVLLAIKRVNPAKGVAAIVGVLCALGGTVIEVESPQSSVFVRIQ